MHRGIFHVPCVWPCSASVCHTLHRMQYTIRKATLLDVPALLELRIGFLHEYQTQLAATRTDGSATASQQQNLSAEYETNVKNGTYVCYVAATSEEVVGCCNMVYFHLPSGIASSHKQAYVFNMYTRPHWRCKGIATQLVKSLISHVKLHEPTVKAITLHSTKDAVNIYKKAGFKDRREGMAHQHCSDREGDMWLELQ